MENVGAGHLSMPEQEMHTTSFWLHFPEAFLARFPDLSPTERQSGIVGLGNALRAVASLLLMCDPRDLGVSITEDISQGAGELRAEPVPLRQLHRRHRPERPAVPHDPAVAREHGAADRALRMRGRLPELRRPRRRSRRARQVGRRKPAGGDAASIDVLARDYCASLVVWCAASLHTPSCFTQRCSIMTWSLNSRPLLTPDILTVECATAESP